jgi:carboxymethylenebutenolidase
MNAIRALSFAVIALVLTACAARDDSLARVAAEHAGDKPVPAAAAAGPPAKDVLTQTVTYGHEGATKLQGFIAWPEAAEQAPPAVIVIHEWWGLNDNIREMARKLATEGYVALAVDLYGGQTAETPEKAGALIGQALSNEAAVERNLQQAYEFLDTNAQAPRIGSIGWCVGGYVSLEAALLLPELDATVIYYGELVQDRERLARLNAPLLGIFGGKDDSIPVAEVEKFEQTLHSLGKSIEVHIYYDSNHAFANPSGTRYDADAASDAWKRTLAFLDAHLK